jgi:hypothetical protein
MWATSLLLLAALNLAAPGSQNSSYLRTIQARWDASDLVCIGKASAPVRTGVTQVIDGRDRDQLSTDVELERCLKGDVPRSSGIRVLGDYVASAKDSAGGFAYSGPPVGFVREGRNLIFLRRTTVPDEFVVTVPIYQTAIPLSDVPPDYPPATSPGFTATIVIRELESAMLQLGELSDLEYIDYLLDYMGTPDGIAELSRLSDTVPLAIQQDIAVTLLDHDQSQNESTVISLLLDPSALAWKRENAALALGRHGTHAALDPLLRVVLEPAGTEQLKMLHNAAESSLDSLKHRVGSLDK